MSRAGGFGVNGPKARFGLIGLAMLLVLPSLAGVMADGEGGGDVGNFAPVVEELSTDADTYQGGEEFTVRVEGTASDANGAGDIATITADLVAPDESTSSFTEDIPWTPIGSSGTGVNFTFDVHFSDETAHGPWSVEVTVSDDGSSGTGSVFFEVLPPQGPDDVTPPTTSASVSPSPASNGWILADQATVTIRATDDLDDEPTIFHRFGTEGGFTAVTGTKAVIPVSNEGSSTIQYHATDDSGNQAPTKQVTLRLDSADPTLVVGEFEDTIEQSDRWSIEVTATDSGSGIASVDVNVTNPDGIVSQRALVAGEGGSFAATLDPFHKSGEYTVNVTATDKAGRVTGVAPIFVTVNPPPLPPEVAIIEPKSGKVSGTVPVQVRATDDHPGLGSVVFRIINKTGPEDPDPPEFQLTGPDSDGIYAGELVTTDFENGPVRFLAVATENGAEPDQATAKSELNIQNRPRINGASAGSQTESGSIQSADGLGCISADVDFLSLTDGTVEAVLRNGSAAPQTLIAVDSPDAKFGCDDDSSLDVHFPFDLGQVEPGTIIRYHLEAADDGVTTRFPAVGFGGLDVNFTATDVGSWDGTGVGSGTGEVQGKEWMAIADSKFTADADSVYFAVELSGDLQATAANDPVWFTIRFNVTDPEVVDHYLRINMSEPDDLGSLWSVCAFDVVGGVDTPDDHESVSTCNQHQGDAFNGAVEPIEGSVLAGAASNDLGLALVDGDVDTLVLNVSRGAMESWLGTLEFNVSFANLGSESITPDTLLDLAAPVIDVTALEAASLEEDEDDGEGDVTGIVVTDASDLASVKLFYRFDGGSEESVDVVAGAAELPEFNNPGSLDLWIVAQDILGNIAQSDVVEEVVADVTKPDAFMELIDGPLVQGQTITLNASRSTDFAGIISYSWDLDGDETEDFSESDEGEQLVRQAPQITGPNVPIRLKVVDANGLVNTTVQMVTIIDVTAPILTVTGPLANTIVGEDSIDVTGTVIEHSFPDGGPEVEILLDGVKVADAALTPLVGATSSWSADDVSLAGKSGPISVQIRSTDEAGNVALTSGRFIIVDLDAPVLDLGAFRTTDQGNTLVFAALGSDGLDGSGLDAASFAWCVGAADGCSSENDLTVTGSSTLHHTFQDSGLHVVRVRATDLAGNAATDRVLVDVRAVEQEGLPVQTGSSSGGGGGGPAASVSDDAEGRLPPGPVSASALDSLRGAGFGIGDGGLLLIDTDGDGSADGIEDSSGNIALDQPMQELGLWVLSDAMTGKMAVFDPSAGTAAPVASVAQEDTFVIVDDQPSMANRAALGAAAPEPVQIEVTIPKNEGWIHVVMQDPAPGYDFASLVRSDGVVLPLEQAWRSDDGMIHFVDDPDVTYTLTYDAEPFTPTPGLWIGGMAVVFATVLVSVAIVVRRFKVEDCAF